MLEFLKNPVDSIFQTLNQGLKSHPVDSQNNYVSIILDEVAIEGLDGITLPVLKYRLKKRSSPEQNFQFSSEFILQVLKVLNSQGKINAYSLPEPRKFDEPVDRLTFVKNENDTVVIIDPEHEVEDPYPFDIVGDNGIMGSCATYYTRKLIHEIQISLKDEYSVVFVASQSEREKALLGLDFDPLLVKMLQPMTYAMLERIGRSRYAGESTIGKVSMKMCKLSPKDLFYQRKKLLK